tara:strand:- start:221 stop:883 length:663 start_codon:yes stop_codon:yes gene_type:complete
VNKNNKYIWKCGVHYLGGRRGYESNWRIRGLNLNIYDDHLEVVNRSSNFLAIAMAAVTSLLSLIWFSPWRWKKYKIAHENIYKIETKGINNLDINNLLSLRKFDETTILINHKTDSGDQVLRLDLSPSMFSFHGKKKIVQKMQDVLLTNGILGQFISNEPDISVTSHDSFSPTEAGNLSKKKSGTTDVTEQLEKLGNLLEKELITEEEFNEKKKELLANL